MKHKKHKKYRVEMKPLSQKSVIATHTLDDDLEMPAYLVDRVLPRRFYWKFNSDEWTLVGVEEDSDNLAKLKELGYDEASAIEILDKLGIE